MAPPPVRNHQQARVIASLDATARHVDEILLRCGLAYPEVVTALLTLALENVVVEGPEGLFRRASSP